MLYLLWKYPGPGAAAEHGCCPSGTPGHTGKMKGDKRLMHCLCILQHHWVYCYSECSICLSGHLPGCHRLASVSIPPLHWRITLTHICISTDNKVNPGTIPNRDDREYDEGGHVFLYPKDKMAVRFMAVCLGISGAIGIAVYCCWRLAPPERCNDQRQSPATGSNPTAPLAQYPCTDQDSSARTNLYNNAVISQ